MGMSRGAVVAFVCVLACAACASSSLHAPGSQPASTTLPHLRPLGAAHEALPRSMHAWEKFPHTLALRLRGGDGDDEVVMASDKASASEEEEKYRQDDGEKEASDTEEMQGGLLARLQAMVRDEMEKNGGEVSAPASPTNFLIPEFPGAAFVCQRTGGRSHRRKSLHESLARIEAQNPLHSVR